MSGERFEEGESIGETLRNIMVFFDPFTVGWKSLSKDSKERTSLLAESIRIAAEEEKKPVDGEVLYNVWFKKMEFTSVLWGRVSEKDKAFWQKTALAFSIWCRCRPDPEFFLDWLGTLRDSFEVFPREALDVLSPPSFPKKEEGEPEKKGDSVNHPSHYNLSPSGVECITVVEHMPFNVGNAVKYLWRAGHKGAGKEKLVEDLRKAAWYIEREIGRVGKEKES